MQEKSKNNFVIISIHWGISNHVLPHPLQRNDAKRMIAAGADIIFGHHPHVIQRYELINNKPVFYSLGNACFDDIQEYNLYWYPENRKSLMCSIEITNENNITSFELIPINRNTSKSTAFIDLNVKEASEDFWIFIKNNISYFSESLDWIKIINSKEIYIQEPNDYLIAAAELLPEGPYDETTWDIWTDLIKNQTGKKGKELFMPIRFALTGRDKGPELKYLLPFQNLCLPKGLHMLWHFLNLDSFLLQLL